MFYNNPSLDNRTKVRGCDVSYFVEVYLAINLLELKQSSWEFSVLAVPLLMGYVLHRLDTSLSQSVFLQWERAWLQGRRKKSMSTSKVLEKQPGEMLGTLHTMETRIKIWHSWAVRLLLYLGLEIMGFQTVNVTMLTNTL